MIPPSQYRPARSVSVKTTGKPVLYGHEHPELLPGVEELVQRVIPIFKEHSFNVIEQALDVLKTVAGDLSVFKG